MRPRILLLSAIVFVVPPAVCLTMRPILAESVADECRAKPGPAGPAGSHWYYRINNTAGRRCWFLGKEGMEGTKFRLAASEESHRPARKPKAHIFAETAPSTPAQATPAEVAPAPMARGLSTPTWVDENSRLTGFAVPWASMPVPAALDARGSGAMSSHDQIRAATDATEPVRSARTAQGRPAEPPKPPSEAAFSPTMFTGGLAIALALSGAILQLTRRLNKQDRLRTAAACLDAYRQLRADVADTAWRSAPGDRPDGIGGSAQATDPADLGAGLQQLVRDLRRGEAETESLRRFEPDGRHQPRLLLGKAAANRTSRPAAAPARKRAEFTARVRGV
jgi:hypothetical protein